MSEEELDPDSVFRRHKEEPEEGVEKEGFNFEADIDEGTNLFDNKAEIEALQEADKDDGINVPVAPDRAIAPINNPGILEDPVADLRREIENRFKSNFDNIKIEVTPEERVRFLRAALRDEEISFEVHLEGLDVNVRVAIPPESFTTSAAAAVAAWGNSGYNNPDSDMQWLLSFQQIHAWFQVRSVDGVPTSWSTEFCDGFPKLSYIREKMSDPNNFDDIFSMSAPRWRMLVEAMRVAEYKYKLCLEALHDRSFFASADTA